MSKSKVKLATAIQLTALNVTNRRPSAQWTATRHGSDQRCAENQKSVCIQFLINRTIQKFDISSDGFPTETACNPQFKISDWTEIKKSIQHIPSSDDIILTEEKHQSVSSWTAGWESIHYSKCLRWQLQRTFTATVQTTSDETSSANASFIHYVNCTSCLVTTVPKFALSVSRTTCLNFSSMHHLHQPGCSCRLQGW